MKKERKKKYLSVFFFFSYRELSAVSASTAIQCHENKVLICPHKKNYLLDKWNMILLYLQFILYITVDRTVNLLMRTISYWKIYLNSCHEPRVTAFRKVKRSHSQFKLGDLQREAWQSNTRNSPSQKNIISCCQKCSAIVHLCLVWLRKEFICSCNGCSTCVNWDNPRLILEVCQPEFYQLDSKFIS